VTAVIDMFDIILKAKSMYCGTESYRIA